MPLIAATTQPQSEIKIRDFMGDLIALVPTEQMTKHSAQDGTDYEVVVCDLHVVTGERSGQVHKYVHVTQKKLLDLLRHHVGTGNAVTGRLSQSPTGTFRPYLLDPPDAKEMALAAETFPALVNGNGNAPQVNQAPPF